MIFRPFKLTCSNKPHYTITDSLFHTINYLLLFECEQLVNEREEDTEMGERMKIGSIILWFITLSSGAMERVEPGWWMRSPRGLMNTDRCWADWATQWSPPQLQPPAPVPKSPVDWSRFVAMKINGIIFAFRPSDVLLGTPSLSLATNAVQVSGVSKVPWLICQTSNPSFPFLWVYYPEREWCWNLLFKRAHKLIS